MPVARVNGITLYHEETGRGEPLLLIQGIGATSPVWPSQIPTLAQHFRVITFDNRGAGRSDAPPGPYSTRQLADDVAGLLDQLAADRAQIAGTSLGGHGRSRAGARSSREQAMIRQPLSLVGAGAARTTIDASGHDDGIVVKGVAGGDAQQPGTTIQGLPVENANLSSGNGAAGVGIFTPTPGTATCDNVVEGNTLTKNGLHGVTMHSHAPGQNLNGNVIRDNTISGNGSDGDAGIGSAGIDIFGDAPSAAAPIQRTVVTGNKVSDEFLGIWQANVGDMTMRENAIDAATVTIPVVWSVTAPANGSVTGRNAGAFANYAFNASGIGQPQTVSLSFSPPDPSLANAVGVSVWQNGNLLATMNGVGSTPGNTSATFTTSTAAAVLVQVYNYDPGVPVSFQVSVSGTTPMPAAMP